MPVNSNFDGALSPVTREDTVAHYQHLAKLGFTPAKLQMAGFFLPEDKIQSFKGKSAV